jgi:hypothetical protein
MKIDGVMGEIIKTAPGGDIPLPVFTGFVDGIVESGVPQHCDVVIVDGIFIPGQDTRFRKPNIKGLIVMPACVAGDGQNQTGG